MTRIAHVLALLGVNLVPAAGWFVGHWSAGTTLLVYWAENVIACLFVAVRILVHQRMNPRRGHFRYLAPSTDRRTSRGQGSFVKGFLLVALAFSAGHAVFLAVILGTLSHNGEAIARVQWHSVALGCTWVLAFLATDLVVDLMALRRWPFWRIEQVANRGLGRVIVVHLTLIFGLLGVAITGAPSTLFGVFVALKTLYAVGSALPQYDPATAPRWLSAAMNRLPNAHPGRRFEDFWAEDRAKEAERRRRNEEPVSRPGSPDPAVP
ncbi:hypothetical protein H7J88_07245 [Mycolicibacterium flavescens]|uniref:Transmembrane protein n=1 Tax=Mycolicibacterium flavescens TaxID=1776 RepID=A0A1E3RPY7_MYCFV|nr:DUF6498-containing protein [Mycolicibacterium flavescens]MCV7279439.1 hypothetical protein [Mycolicibacterium flavescens]ODQ91956.1 hypothetical protein BHQ18_03675 [Mycolicibacterium flavescens]